MAEDAQKTFEMANGIEETDAIYRYDPDAHEAFAKSAPWEKEYADSTSRLVLSGVSLSFAHPGGSLFSTVPTFSRMSRFPRLPY